MATADCKLSPAAWTGCSTCAAAQAGTLAARMGLWKAYCRRYTLLHSISPLPFYHHSPAAPPPLLHIAASVPHLLSPACSMSSLIAQVAAGRLCGRWLPAHLFVQQNNDMSGLKKNLVLQTVTSGDEARQGEATHCMSGCGVVWPTKHHHAPPRRAHQTASCGRRGMQLRHTLVGWGQAHWSLAAAM